MKENKTIDCCGTVEIVCPDCGNVFSDSRDYFCDGGETIDDAICGKCGLRFMVTLNTDISYTSFYTPEEPQGGILKLQKPQP